MNEEFLDRRMAALAAATASSLGDAVGYAVVLTNSPLIQGERYSPDYDVEADTAIFSGSGVAN